jgi:hypothetical protein
MASRKKRRKKTKITLKKIAKGVWLAIIISPIPPIP